MTQDPSTGTGPAAFVHRLVRATNDRDLEALTACFAPDYRNETPAHPERSFEGREQVRRNWTQIFAAVPDLRATVIRLVTDAETAWAELEHRGTKPDGSAHVMRGVVIFGVQGGRAQWARFYLEPLQDGGGGVDEAVRRALGTEAGS
jgi:ketosteroid isomerase-like protein